MAGQPPATAETLREILDAFNRHDIDEIMRSFADDCSCDLPRGSEPWGTRLLGKAQVRQGLLGRFNGIPDVHYGDDRHVVCGERGVSEWRLTGMTPAGARVDVRGCDLWEFADGKVVRKDSYLKLVEPGQ